MDPIDAGISCQSLKRSGVFLNSIYNLKDANEKYPRMALCDMVNTIGYEDETMEILVGYLYPTSIPGGVMFGAVSDTLESTFFDQDIVFDYTVSNIGNAFDVSTGIFKVPVDGTYQFTFSAYDADSTARAYIQVFKNGLKVFSFLSSNPAEIMNHFGHTWQMLLKKDDQINLHVTGGIWSGINHPVSFVGKLVAE
jgi:hypothetical protein